MMQRREKTEVKEVIERKEKGQKEGLNANPDIILSFMTRTILLNSVSLWSSMEEQIILKTK